MTLIPVVANLGKYKRVCEPQFHPAVSRGINVVALGGGTGLSTLLKGLKGFVAVAGEPQPRQVPISSLCAVVTVSDDGGSSGRLRHEFGMLAPGDVRNCLVALSEDEAVLARLFQFRFPAESALSGHSLGNLFLTALNHLVGDFARTVELASALLNTRGTIVPATSADVQLEAVMQDGSLVRGESRINASEKRISRLRLCPADAPPLPQTIAAIAQADLITIGPGSLFTSLIPNLLVRGIAEAIAASRAVKVFVCNLVTEAHESLGLTAAGHIEAIYRHAGRRLFDYAVLNTEPLCAALQATYGREDARQISIDLPAIRALGVVPVTGNFLDEAQVARHAPDRLAAELLRIATESQDKGCAKSAASASSA